MAEADQRHLNTKVSITDMAAKVENDQQETKLALTQGMLTKMVHAVFTMI